MKTKYRESGLKLSRLLYCVGTGFATYVIHHQCSDGSADLIVGLGFAVWAKQDEEEPIRVAGIKCN